MSDVVVRSTAYQGDASRDELSSTVLSGVFNHR